MTNKKMKNSIKITWIIIIVLIILGILFFNKPENKDNTGNNTGTLATLGLNPLENNETYMHTKAICNSTNFCQDYEIECNGSELISMIPVERAVVQHPQDWQDPRTETDKNKLC